MSEETADAVAQFIIEHLGNRSCLIQWFGGEPLMNTEVIDIVTDRLRNTLGDDRARFMMISNIPDSLLKEEWFAMQKALVNAGFLNPLDAWSLAVRKTQCFACSSKSFVIMPDGSLYKCALATGDKRACVGNVKSGITNYSVFEKWCDSSLREECAECSFLPLCQGGCRAGTLGYISEHCFTQKEFAADVLRERIRLLKG